MGKEPIKISVLEQLWFGKLSDDPAEQEAAQSFAATVAEVQGLRPFSPAVQRLLAAIQDEYFTVDQVSEIIESDTTIAARVMRTINSAGYGLRRECTSVGHAVTMLGANAISQMAAAMAVLDMFAGAKGPAAVITVHSAAVASITRLLADRSSFGGKEVLFTCALLHDVGKLLLLQVSESLQVDAGQDPYAALLARVNRDFDRCHREEREFYGFDHAVLGGHVLRAWQIPEPVPHVVAWHHQPERAQTEGGEIEKQVAMIRLADHIAYATKRDPGEALWSELLDEFAGVLKIDASNLAEWWPDLVTAASSAAID
ncbi:HDOD domain-containing protein [Desulfobulbus sp. AH-315-M07]|nr:HDOD domain-containing protein [Desulfobulbus sp. AH-315-M07]